MKAVQITITEEQYEWLQRQPRAFNLSELVREAIEKKKKREKKEGGMIK